MESQGTAALILIVTVAGLFLVYPLLIGLGNGGNMDETGIVYISVIGNTTDIIYPELGEAQFKPANLSAWTIDVEMVDDSEGFENVSVYSRTFTASNEEINQISDVLFQALGNSSVSERTTLDLLNTSASIVFIVDMIFNDNTWIQVYTFQEHIEFLLLEGTYSGTFDPQAEFPEWSISRNTNMLDGVCQESISNLGSFVNAIHTFFEDHLG